MCDFFQAMQVTSSVLYYKQNIVNLARFQTNVSAIQIVQLYTSNLIFYVCPVFKWSKILTCGKDKLVSHS